MHACTSYKCRLTQDFYHPWYGKRASAVGVVILTGDVSIDKQHTAGLTALHKKPWNSLNNFIMMMAPQAVVSANTGVLILEKGGNCECIAT